MKTIVTERVRIDIRLCALAYIFHFIYPFNQQSLHRYVCINYRKIKIHSPIMHICMHAPCIPGKLLTTEKKKKRKNGWKKLWHIPRFWCVSSSKKIVCIVCACLSLCFTFVVRAFAPLSIFILYFIFFLIK